MYNIEKIIFFKKKLQEELSVFNSYPIHTNDLSNIQLNEFYRRYQLYTHSYLYIKKHHSQLIKDIDTYIYKYCSHEWENDFIEFSNEVIKPIRYCIHCELNDPKF